MQQQIEKVMVDKYGTKRLQVERECLTCKNKFWTRKHLSKRNRGQYCSKKCTFEARRKRRITVICSGCGKASYVLPRIANRKTKHGFRFCSNACKQKQHKIGGLIQPSHYGTGKKRNVKFLSKDGLCLYCKKELIKFKKAFCSEYCKKQLAYESKVKEWRLGLRSGNNSDNESLCTYVRRYMLERANYKCEKCGWSEKNEFSGKIPLTINHKDGNSSNSIEGNLETICPNCHALTSNFGSLNRGNGRKLRREKKSQKTNGAITQHVRVSALQAESRGLQSL